MFIDKIVVTVIGGNGGNGSKDFRREKYVPDGGPDGGDGGRGGSIIFRVDSGMRTLMDFKFKSKFVAENGQNGMRKSCYGKSGKDLILPVPPGTTVKDENNIIIADLTEPGEEVVIAKGGRGGRGNRKFATPTRRTPNFSEPGFKGEEKKVTIELKLIADVGLLGFPNVGKSTFLSNVSDATPKIANYHFTTIKPNLGVVNLIPGKSFVIADIPGLINGASKGIGLGFEFLRHVERTRILIHFVDVSGIEGRDPIKDFDEINLELKQYNEQLANRVQIIAANKIDLLSEDNDNLEKFTLEMEKRGFEVFPISAATSNGLIPLLKRVTELLDTVEVIPLFDDSELIVEFEEKDTQVIDIVKKKGIYYVTGVAMDRLIFSTDFENLESMRRFHRVLEHKNVIDRLRKMGIVDGEIVNIEGYELEFVE
ncbi:MAG: GTPase ObgE [Bacillota bacterium]|nr:GTPase ObgE [Bacillota bacterium]